MNFVALLRKAERRYGEEYRKASPHGGITRQRLDLLNAIEDKPRASQTFLCEATGMDRSTVSTMVVALEAEGLIYRERGKQDARTFLVTITPQGRAALRRALKIAQAAEGIMLSNLGATGRAQLLQHLTRIAENGRG